MACNKLSQKESCGSESLGGVCSVDDDVVVVVVSFAVIDAHCCSDSIELRVVVVASAAAVVVFQGVCKSKGDKRHS